MASMANLDQGLTLRETKGQTMVLQASDKSLYLWVRLAKEQSGTGGAETSQLKAEVSRLKAELKRANEERDILKKAATYFAKLSG